jgi:parvulin-like peptidyl-prolyl isomerase
MPRLSRISLRSVLIGGFVVYLLADLSFHGPVGHRLALLRPGSPDSIAKARAEGVIARVYFQPIHRSQLERAIREKGCPPEQALGELIDDQLLRHRLEDEKGLSVTPAEIDEAFRRFSLKFETPEDLATALKAEGFPNESALRERLEHTILLEKLITRHTAEVTKVSDDEARAWFGKHAAELATPERLQARQVFLATLDREPAEARQKLDAALADLTAKKKTFEALVAELTEDDGSKPRAGDLGWMTRERLPADFVLPLFGLEKAKPTLIRTKLGWHLVEVTDRKPATPADFDKVKPEIIAALEAKKKAVSIDRFREELRAEAAGKIEIFLGAQ